MKKSQRKVAFLVNAYFPDVHDILDNLQKAMPDVLFYYVLLSHTEQHRRWIIRNGSVSVVHIPNIKIVIFGKEFIFNHGISRTLSSIEPDVLFVFPWSEVGIFQGINWARKNNVPCLGIAIGPRKFHWNWSLKIRASFSHILIKSFVSKIDELIVYGDSVGQGIKQIIGTLKCPITSFQQSIDHAKFTPKFHPDAIRYRIEFLKCHGISTDKPIVGFVGQLNERKGIQNFLQLAEKMLQSGYNISFLIVGYGPKIDSVQKMIRLFPSNIFHVEYVPEKEYQYFFSVLDTLIVPSFHEDWGHVVNEAMLSAVPVVASDGVYAALDLIYNRGFGLIYQVEKWDQLYSKVVFLLNNLSQFRHKSIMAREYLLKHRNVDKSTNIMVKCINKYINVSSRS